jgi:predicted Zn-dependent protease with MMP-like domain
MRGPLAHPPVPLALSRREEFDEQVLAAAEKVDDFLVLERGVTLLDVDFVVEEMPLFAEGEEPDVVPFGRVEPARGTTPATVVIYRRTLELRSEPGEDRAELIHDAVVEQIADLLGLDVDDVDPGFED